VTGIPASVEQFPLLFTCVCTFIGNDLDDVERDRVNHPERPLPAGELSAAVAGIMYFTCLSLALFSTRHYVTPGIAFWYYGLIAISISYGYVVECFPSLKAPYVAVVSSIPVLIVAAWYPRRLDSTSLLPLFSWLVLDEKYVWT